MGMELSTRSVTREMLKIDIRNYLASLPDEERWSDMFDASAGNTLIDILVGITEMLLYKLNIARKDSYLPESITPTATYLLGSMLGYNPNRKTAATGVVNVTFKNAITTPFSIPESFQFDYDIPLVSSSAVTVSPGNTTKAIPVYQGEWITKVFSYDTNNLEGIEWEVLVLDENEFQIDQFKVNVDVDGLPLTVVQRVETYNDESVIVRTDYKGGIQLRFGNGQTGYRLRASSVVTVRYLRTLGIAGNLNPAINLGPYVVSGNEFTAVTGNILGGSDEDSVAKIKTLASQFYQTQGRAVTQKDWVAILMSYPGVISANAKRDEVACCTINVAVVLDTEVALTSPEQTALFEYLDDYKMESAQVAYVQPTWVDLTLDITIVVDLYFVDTGVQALIEAYIAENYTLNLGATFRSTKTASDLIDVVGAKRVYLTAVNLSAEYPDIALTA